MPSEHVLYTVLEQENEKIRYRCEVCGRLISSKQRVLTHLFSIHNLGPVKRVKKTYLDDPSIPVPRRTLSWRKKFKPNLAESVHVMDEKPKHTFCAATIEKELLPQVETSTCMSESADGECEVDSRETKGKADPFEFTQENLDVNRSLQEDTIINITQSDTDESSDEAVFSSSDSEYYSTGISSSDSDDSFSADEDCKHNLPTSNNVTNNQSISSEQQALCILSYMLRHNTTAAAGKDLILLLQSMFPDDKNIQALSFSEMLHKISKSANKTFNYCKNCHELFPDNKDIFKCSTPTCDGLRYEGNLERQLDPRRKPKDAFVVADVGSQLKLLFEKEGVWNSINNTKSKILNSVKSGSHMCTQTAIQDITDGECYKELCQPGCFLSHPYTFSGIFNTDGIPLYSSTKVKLWPIFIAINELNICSRFARENLILAGIWQGKNVPPFFQYLSAFGAEICDLYHKGLSYSGVNVRFGVFLGTVDLQAKGYVMNMTMHNGEYGCITCEEPGITVKQGKGTAKHYPYRTKPERYQIRDSEALKLASLKATRKKRIKGICGPSGLITIPAFDLVLGMVPDYMHGILLGVTKTILKKFFSPENSKKGYFIGRHIHAISVRMKNIKPPDYIDRVPRDLSKHYQNLKAVELQAWLLYYSLPCLHGYLPDKYFKHFAKFSEGVHILLGDTIEIGKLERADMLLDEFYQEFESLYGAGSCGLNVHNIGMHLAFYVKKWGPIFGWSCFGFEDANASILSYAHGTKDVTKQILEMNAAHMAIKTICSQLPASTTHPTDIFLRKMNTRFSRRWIGAKQAAKCSIAGALKAVNCSKNIDMQYVYEKCSVLDITELQQVTRILIGDDKFYSKEYTKMQRKICYVVLCENGVMLCIHTFLFKPLSGEVFAMGNKLVLAENCFLSQNEGHHIIKVNESAEMLIEPVENIKEKLFYMQVDGHTYISRTSNKYGHGILK